MNKWDSTSYQKITNAKFTHNKIEVSFENGDVVKIPKEVLISDIDLKIEWDKLKYHPYEIIIPAESEKIEIPWDELRVVTDKEYARYLANRAEEQARLIGNKIKQLREKKRIKGSELAERSGLTPQTISRIEQGHTDVSFSTLKKILASMGYTLKDLAKQEYESDIENAKKSYNQLIRKLGYVGIDSNLLTNKIIPNRIQRILSSDPLNQPELILDEAASYVSNIYGWSLEEIWGKQDLIIKDKPYEMAYYKKPANAVENQIKAYSHYAYYLAKIVLKSFLQKTKNEYPESLEEFKSSYLKKYQEIDLKSLLEFVWDLGICVLPLNDPGVFHGASWNIEGKHIIVLKQNTQFHSRWIFDLLHELYHIFTHLDKDNSSVIEVEEPNPFSDNEAIEELEANSFANQFIFGNRAEELAEKSVDLAKWKMEYLKNAVIKIAKKENIREDFLANYLAFRLSYQGQNWWGSASKLQIVEPNPFALTTNVLKDKIKMDKLSPMDYNLLSTALTN